MSGHENDWRAIAACEQTPLHFQAGHSAEPNVHQQTAEIFLRWIGNECLRRVVLNGFEIHLAQGTTQRFAEADIVIDDRNSIRGVAHGDIAELSQTFPDRLMWQVLP